jgi:hypothetical protein
MCITYIIQREIGRRRGAGKDREKKRYRERDIRAIFSGDVCS